MYIKIAICEDNKNDMDKLIKLLNRFDEEHGCEVEYTCFSRGVDLLDNYSRNKFDVIFMDMEINNENGIDILRKIRLLPDDNVKVVITTSYPDYMLRSFSVQPTDYILKPLEYEDIDKCMIELLRKIELDNQKRVILNIGHTSRILRFNEILYVQAVTSMNTHSKIVFFTENEQIKVNGKLADFEKTLCRHNFVQIHRSTIVNCSYIKQFDSEKVVLHNDVSLKISRRKSKEVKALITKVITKYYAELL